MVFPRTVLLPTGRPAGLLACVICLAAASACSPESGKPRLVDIPMTEGRSGESDKRVLEPFTGDLDALVERGWIRVLLTPSRTNFTFTRGVYFGRQVDAAIFFERFVNRRIAPATIRVALMSAEESSLAGDIVKGQADIAANLRRTFERDDQVAFATPWRNGVRELIVTGPGVPPLVSLEDAGGRSIHVWRNSDHYGSLVRLNEQLKKINRPPATIVTAATSQTAEDLLELVNSGKIPATVVDDYIYDVWRTTFSKTASNRDVAVSQDGEIAWATRKDAPKLLALVNEFFANYRLAF